jgi:glycosyltransferase involved in cell wall biosynthesis
MKLSILICTLPERKQMFDELVANLNNQINAEKETLLDRFLNNNDLSKNEVIDIFLKDDDIKTAEDKKLNQKEKKEKEKQKAIRRKLKININNFLDCLIKGSDSPSNKLDSIENLRPKDLIEIVSDDEVGINIGHKRNLLLKKATGEFIVFIDDDDAVSETYIRDIFYTIIDNPDIDCIAINGIITTNGENKCKWFISKEYKSWYEEKSVKKGVEYVTYYRTPNHISPVRRSIACNIGFPSMQHGEDYHYSMNILPFLNLEAEIKESIYHYRYKTEK